MIEGIFLWAAAIAGFAAGALWIIATKKEEPAPDETAGTGGLMGGYLITKNAKGERIDMHGTYVLQARWNGYAAYATASAAILTALSLIAKAYHV